MLNKLLVATYEYWWLILFFIVLIVVDWSRPYDSTDDAENGERSGMVLYTDNMTGCQYLEAGIIGGMTPRLDGTGKHVGCN